MKWKQHIECNRHTSGLLHIRRVTYLIPIHVIKSRKFMPFHSIIYQNRSYLLANWIWIWVWSWVEPHLILIHSVQLLSTKSFNYIHTRWRKKNHISIKTIFLFSPICTLGDWVMICLIRLLMCLGWVDDIDDVFL